MGIGIANTGGANVLCDCPEFGRIELDIVNLVSENEYLWAPVLINIDVILNCVKELRINDGRMMVWYLVSFALRYFLASSKV